MYFDDRAVQTDRFDFDAYELLMLQFLEQAIQHPSFCPAIHARVDRVPVAESFGQRSPFTAIFRDVQDRVDDLKVTERDVAALYRQERLDTIELLRGDFHAA